MVLESVVYNNGQTFLIVEIDRDTHVGMVNTGATSGVCGGSLFQ